MVRRESVVSRLLALQHLPGIIRETAERVRAFDTAVTRLRVALDEAEDRLTRRMETLDAKGQDADKRVAMYLGDYTVIASTIYDTFLLLDTRDLSFTPRLLKDRSWELPTSKVFLRLVKPGMTVVEIGANFGYFTTLGGALVGTSGTYYAFEPNDDTCRYLESSVTVNGLAKIVTVVNKAVSDQSGTTTLHKSTAYSTNTNITLMNLEELAGMAASFTETSVDVVSLDEFFAPREQRIDIVKIDAEGSEPRILRGMERILRENEDIVLILEFSRWWIERTEDPLVSMRYLRDLGFRFWMIRGSEDVKVVDRRGELKPIALEELQDIPLCELVIARSLGESSGR